MISAQRRVVVTGMGMILPLGNSKEELWDALTSGRSGVRCLDTQLAAILPTAVAAPASQFQGEIDDFGSLDKEQKKAIRKGLKVMCRECQMGVAAAQRALVDAGLVSGTFDPLRTGIAFNSDYMVTVPEEFIEPIRQCINGGGTFDFARWADSGLPKMSPLWLLKYLPNMPASHLAIYNDLQGPNNSLTLREAGANAAVAESLATILDGRADIMLCGATGTRLHPLKAIHAVQQEEVAAGNGDPAKASRPFDRDRCGMVLGEGAAAIVLEELTSAQGRGATIYGEVVAGATSSVADRRLLARRDLAMKNVLQMVITRSGYSPDQIGHLHAHGLSTRTSDTEEAWAVGAVFGDRNTPLPVTAAKSYFGNLGAGSGMAEIAASTLALHQRRLFPVLNYETPDPDCPLAVVTEECDPGASFINLSVTPQGQASAILIRRFDS